MGEQLATDQLIARGREAYTLRDYPSALADFREVVRREPRFADIHHLVGICYMLLGSPDEAVDSFDRAIEINSRYVEALVNRAITLNELGRTEEARESFEAASEADVEEGVGRFPGVLAGRLANKLMELGDLYAEGEALEDAAEQYRRAVELRPRYVDIRAKYARVLLEQGAAEEAARELERILEINSGFVGARVQLGLARFRMGETAEAREEWERCLAERPGHPQAELYLGMLSRSESGSADA